jgi:hypothetical protein
VKELRHSLQVLENCALMSVLGSVGENAIRGVAKLHTEEF